MYIYGMMRLGKSPVRYIGRLLCGNYSEYCMILNNVLVPKNLQIKYPSAFIHSTSLAQQSIVAIENRPQVEELDKLYKLIEIEIRGNDKAVLKSYTQFATTAAEHLGIEIGKCWTPTKAHHERFTVLKSIHVNKKNMVQYEFRTYFRFMQFHKLTGSTADTYLEYIQRNLPEGVAMKVTKVGLEKVPDHLKPPKMLEETTESAKEN